MNWFRAWKSNSKPAQQNKDQYGNGKNTNYVQILNDIAKTNKSYEMIMLDILDDGNKQKLGQDSQQIYQELVCQGQQDYEEGIENIYMNEFVFINKLTQPKQLTIQEWDQMIEKGSTDGFPIKNIYFSIFKGIKFQVRKKVWELFANTKEMKKLTQLPYKQLTNPQSLSSENLSQIDKDVPRSKSITKYFNELRNILIAYCVLTKNQYTQGMNLIAGALLTLLALENDEELQEFEIAEKQFEERTFWVFIGIMVWKKWDGIFDKELAGLTQRLSTLEKLMVEHVPSVYQKLIDYEWDLTIFSQYYITIMLYNTPRQFSKIILDLFFLDGENALHSLIIRMMKMQEQKILGLSDECQLMNYFKKEIIVDCYLSVKKNQANAKKLQDFQINFMKLSKN